MVTVKSEGTTRKEHPYLSTPDLTMVNTYTIPRWRYYPGKVIADLQAAQSLPLFLGPNTRSRIAQSGIVGNEWHAIRHPSKNNIYRGILRNYSARDIVLPEGFGFGPLYNPSTSLVGEELFEKVRTGIDIDPKHLYFSTLLGSVFPSLNLKPEHVPQLRTFGIQVNTEKMWEVNPEPKEPLIINDELHTRKAVEEFLIPVKDSVTSTPFVVTTTMPADLHGLEATVLTDLYNPLVHSPSVIHFPNEKYKWNGTTGEGIRLELIATDKNWISQDDLEYDFPVAFFTAH